MLPKTVSMRWANGGAASAPCCARRSLEAATICIALVIFCVALVAAMRTRMSLRLAIGLDLSACRGAARHHRNCLRKCLRIRVDRSLELGGGGVIEVLAVADDVEDALMLGTHQRQQTLLERVHPIDRDGVAVAVDAGINGDDLLLDLQRGELRLLEQLGQPRSAGEQALGGGIEVGAELRECRHFAVLRELALDAA